MLRQNTSCINWQFLLVGLFFIIMQCDARAVNVSNTWTMPQEGLNVFYRFFRDRISWFEADAVCQFHHANLVTVDNSFQFDATRDLLRELDVNDIVWIGLMRPQSSDRFMWSSNSRPLVADTGYWAESLPLMDAPLCAVIDPIRDYRWHALRCGGPETASFLCEMPVPSWADACNLKDMPNLTLQYMADTASIELIRNCQEEGLLRTMCRGKQDRERALQDLICPRERLEAQRINDITNSHFKSLQIINSIPSDNNENNDIELMPLEVNYGPHFPEELQTEKNTVQRLIEQFNVDELMQADEPSNMETVSSFYKIPGLIPKPVKKSAKKVLDYPKKDNGKQKMLSNMEQSQKDKKRMPIEMDDMMMGDQPLQGEPEMPEQILNEEVSNEIMEPLPHIKKTNIHKEDGMEKMEKEAIAIKKSMQKNKMEMENKKMLMMSSSTTSTTTTTTTTEPTTTTTTTTTTEAPTTTTVKPSTEQQHLTTTETVSNPNNEQVTKITEDHAHKHHHDTHMDFDNAGTTTSSAAIGHPMHPQQPRSNGLNEESQHAHAKESVDSSHFIPPMLMVKSHYVPPANKHGHNEHEHHHHHQQQPQQKQPDDAPPHLETNTEGQAETATTTTIKQEQNQTTDMKMMAVTTPKVLDLEKTTLKTLDTENEQKQITETGSRQEEEESALKSETATTTTTESVSSIKPITEQQTTETEQSKNDKNLHSEKITTTMTATILQAHDTTTTTAAATATAEEEGTTQKQDKILTNIEEINKNTSGSEKTEDETQELRPPQIQTQQHTETTEATKLIEITEKFLKSTESEKTPEIADATTTVVATITNEQHVITTEKEKPTTTINSEVEEDKEHLQTKLATETEKTELTTEKQQTSTTTQSAETAPATIKTTVETQSLQQTDKEQQNEEKQKDVETEKEDKTETIVKTTEILETSSSSSSTSAAEKEEDTEQEKVEEATQTTINSTPTTTTETATTTTIASTTTTTTIKPITTTTPQNEVKSTETSVSSSTESSSTTTTISPSTTTIKDDTTTTSSPSSSSSSSTTTTTIATPADITSTTIIITETENENDSIATTTTTSNSAEISTQTPTTTSPPETTRNFLKVTTEMPFKPNRRRSLTKPETVSYMKKILG